MGTVLPQIMGWVLISLQQLVALATKWDRYLLFEVLNQSFLGDEL